MKVFNEKNSQVKKSWSLRLEKDETGFVGLSAVDSHDGTHIAYIFEFKANGMVLRNSIVKGLLYDQGYDPHEHGNQFDEGGGIQLS